MDSNFYYVERNGKNEWRVYAVTLSGGRGTLLSSHTTKQGAYAAMNQRYAVK